MHALNLPVKEKSILDAFVELLRKTYGDGLQSVIAYGSSVGPEFIHGGSNINLLVVLNDTGLASLNPISGFLARPAAHILHPIFFTEHDLQNSLDVFPIEFLDAHDRYMVLAGRDILKDIRIDRKNLRFQCEQELKSRLLNIKTSYVKNPQPHAVRALLVSACTSLIPLIRNTLRLKGIEPPQDKETIVTEAAREFQCDAAPFLKTLKLKKKELKISGEDAYQTLSAIITQTERIISWVDAL